MIKNKEEIIETKTEKITKLVKRYIEEIDILSEKEELTIEKIEKIWGEMDKNVKEVYQEISSEVISQINEKAIIASKKENTQGEE